MTPGPSAAASGRGRTFPYGGHFYVNISKYEQRVLHALAQGGRIEYRRDPHGKVVEFDCLNRDGWRLDGCTLGTFAKLRKRRLVASSGGAPYRITRAGLIAVRAQLDNR